jgi:hypothetical protein
VIAWWKRTKLGTEVPQPSFSLVSDVRRPPTAMKYLNDMIHGAHIVQISSWSAIQEELGKIERAFPGFEAAFVNIGLDVGIIEAQGGVRFEDIFLRHDLQTNIKELPPW